MASRCSSSNTTGISQNSRVSGDDNLIGPTDVLEAALIDGSAAGAALFSTCARRHGLLRAIQWQVCLLDLLAEPLAKDFVLLLITQFGEELRQFLAHLLIVERKLRANVNDIAPVRRVRDVAAHLARF